MKILASSFFLFALMGCVHPLVSVKAVKVEHPSIGQPYMKCVYAVNEALVPPNIKEKAHELCQSINSTTAATSTQKP